MSQATRQTLERLVRLGLPEQYLPARINPNDPMPALLKSLAGLPQASPAPSLGGSVLAITGERMLAFWLARQLSGELRLDPNDVVLAAADAGGLVPEELFLGNPTVAWERRRSWSRRPTPILVVVEARPGTLEVPWARHMLDVLEPSAVWGVVEAIRKPEDVAAWSEDLGRIDALLVEGLGATTSPAAILGSGIPVARVDGRPAGPATWAALLAARLAA